MFLYNYTGKRLLHPFPKFGQHLDSNRLQNWALKRLQRRHDIHKELLEHNIQILTQDNLTLKFEKTVKIKSLNHQPLHLAPPNITAQSFFLHSSQQILSRNTIDI